METLAWAGNIVLPSVSGDDRSIELIDLQFHSSREHQTIKLLDLSVETMLHYLAYVDTRDVPLCLLLGPRMDVYTQATETEDYLWETLVGTHSEESFTPSKDNDIKSHEHNHDSWTSQSGNPAVWTSNIGVLLQVGDGNGLVSQILLYAATESLTAQNELSDGLMTPRRSSSPIPHDSAVATSSSTRVYAQPLRSYDAVVRNALSPPLSPSRLSNDGLFLSWRLDTQIISQGDQGNATCRADPGRHSSPKRQRVDVFSAATSAQRRMQRRGGKAAQMMAGSSGSLANSGASTKLLSRLSRAHTTGSFAADAVIGEQAEARSTSRHASPLLGRPLNRPSTSGSASIDCRGTVQSRSKHARQASLHHMTSLSSVSTGLIRAALETDERLSLRLSTMDHADTRVDESPRLTVPLASNDAGDIGSRPLLGHDAANKTALSRVVLAALRLWGFSALQQPLGAEEDFKALYHAAYSAAKFSLRHESVDQCWSQESMRAAADRVLELFLA